LVSSEGFRKCYSEPFKVFIRNYLFWLAQNTQLLITGNTYDCIVQVLEEQVSNGEITRKDVDVITSSFIKLPPRSKGVVALTTELIESNLVAVLHLSHCKDIHKTLAHSVLRRQCQVHNIVYASTLKLVEDTINDWKAGAAMEYPPKSANILPLSTLLNHPNKGQNNIAMIAHDGKKLELCALALEFLPKVLAHDYILCTGTTGTWLKKFMGGALLHCSNIKLSQRELEQKLVLCLSGPNGGDVQIAHAALTGLCPKVIFLIDPMAAHPHEPDIRFFEQAIEGAEIKLATNSQSAKHLLGAENGRTEESLRNPFL